jgi:DNA-binding NarL/FixJ family response regulator
MQRRLLIIDDHAGFRRFARMLLEAAGYEVVGEAVDGASGLAAVRELRPEVVLLDIQLPDTDGLAVAARIDSYEDRPAVVLISTRAAGDYGSRLANARARGFISKTELSGARLADVLESTT